jgi:signal transduction histidine kinase
MSETDLVLLAGLVAGLVASFLGGFILYRNRLQTHLRLRERVEEERTALQDELSAINKEELAETDAGKQLMRYSQTSIQKFGYAREDPRTGLKRHNLDLLKQIDEHKKRLAQSEERLEAMAASQQETEKVIENLKKENEEWRAANSLQNSIASTNSAQIEQNLRITLEELARLQNQLAQANMRLIEIEAGGIAAFSEELRQTLSSTLQYVDLLLGESAGTLNAMQRNFLETIKGSTTRLHDVIEDFIRVTTLKDGSGIHAHEGVDLNQLIQHAIEDASSQIRAKRITLGVDQPENSMTIYADREALGQILIRLLSNAGAASDLKGTVNLRVQIKAEDGKDHLLIQVSDTGGGIPPEDLGRVFTPLYRATDIPARGVGDTGIGLFMAKTFTETQNGRIWLDTELGVGSTYNVLIPIARETQVNVSAEESD